MILLIWILYFYNFQLKKESYKLIYEIQTRLKNIFVYLILRQNEQNELMFQSQEILAFYKYLETQNLILEPYNIGGLLDIQISELLQKYAKIRMQENENEVSLIIIEQDPEKLKKIQDDSKAKLGPIIKGIDKDALQIIANKSEGNPMISFQLILASIKAHYLENKEGYLMPTEEFNTAKILDDWSFIDVPDLATRLNSKHLSLLSKISIKDLICLKAASVIGNIFTLRQLKYISPLITEGMVDLIKRVVILDEMKIIEIIDDDGVSDMTCRFLIPFIRETLYQRLLYRDQKKCMHSMSAEFLLNNSIPSDLDNECQRMIKHLLISEDIPEISFLTIKSKRQIIVKKVSNLLQKDTKIIKSGILTKQGENLKKNIESYFLNLNFKIDALL